MQAVLSQSNGLRTAVGGADGHKDRKFQPGVRPSAADYYVPDSMELWDHVKFQVSE